MTKDPAAYRAGKSEAIRTALAILDTIPRPLSVAETKAIRRAASDRRTAVYKLTQSYNSFNQRFFAGRLPKFTVAYAKEGMSADTSFRGRLILLSPASRTDARLRRRELLHEMCHVAAGARALGHGLGWKTQMRRLATIGEGWAEKEADMYPAQLRRLESRLRPR